MAKSVRTGGGGERRRASERRRKTEEQTAGVESPQSTADDVRAKLAALAESTPNGPTRESIAQRAYALYLERGGMHGYDIEDWLQAERELSVK